MCNRLEQCAFFQRGNAEMLLIWFPLIPRAQVWPWIGVFSPFHCRRLKESCRGDKHILGDEPLDPPPLMSQCGTNTDIPVGSHWSQQDQPVLTRLIGNKQTPGPWKARDEGLLRFTHRRSSGWQRQFPVYLMSLLTVTAPLNFLFLLVCVISVAHQVFYFVLFSYCWKRNNFDEGLWKCGFVCRSDLKVTCLKEDSWVSPFSDLIHY